MVPPHVPQRSAQRHGQEHLAAAVPQQDMTVVQYGSPMPPLAGRVLVGPPGLASQPLPVSSLDGLLSPDACGVPWPQHPVHQAPQHNWGGEDALFLPDAGIMPSPTWSPSMENPMPVGDGHLGAAWVAERSPYILDQNLPPSVPKLDMLALPDKEQLLLHSLLTSLDPRKAPTTPPNEAQPLPETVRLLSALLASSPSLSETLSKVLLYGPPGLSHPAAMGA